MGFLDRMMRSSVDRALKMQPRKVQRVADETRYTSPKERPVVDAIRAAGARVSRMRFDVGDLAAIAVRRDLGAMTVTEFGADLADIDGRCLATWIPGDPETAAGATVDARNAQLFAALTSDDAVGAVVLAYPPYLMAIDASGDAPPLAGSPLGERAGRIEAGGVAGIGVWVLGGSVISAGTSPVDAMARLEAAERLVQIAAITRKDRHD
jgi:hypothetical protein